MPRRAADCGRARGGSGGGAVALLVLLAAAAGAGVVAADLRLVAHDGARFDHVAVDVVPAAVDGLEAGGLVVGDGLVADLVGGDELDGAGVVARLALVLRADLEALPARLLGPLLGGGAVDVVGAGRVVAGDDPVDLAEHVGGVARAHERLGGRRRR